MRAYFLPSSRSETSRQRQKADTEAIWPDLLMALGIRGSLTQISSAAYGPQNIRVGLPPNRTWLSTLLYSILRMQMFGWPPDLSFHQLCKYRGHVGSRCISTSSATAFHLANGKCLGLSFVYWRAGHTLLSTQKVVARFTIRVLQKTYQKYP